MVLDERVAYLEDAIKLGGAAYRAARISLGAPAVELDDYLALKERAEKAERCSLALDDTVARQGERVAHEGTRSMLDCERHGHDLTKAWRDRLRNEPHLIEAGQTKYDADVWRARCLDAEAKMGAELDRVRADAGELRAKVTRQRRELRRLNRDVALLRGGRAEKPAAKAEEKPADDRVVRVGDAMDSAERAVGGR